ncbi:MAG: tryptophan-rich sensory protein [Deinococcales bacterium]
MRRSGFSSAGPPARGLAPVAVIAAYLGMVIVNALAVTLPIGGLTTQEVSALYPALFVPAGYVFSIWSVIYLGLGVYAVVQALPGAGRSASVRAVAWWFVLSCVLNGVWLVLWQTLHIYWTVPVMAALLLTLIVIYRRLRREPPAHPLERWAVRTPFSVYLGWISVATIANVSDALLHAGWGGWGLSDVTWAVIMLAVATLLGAAMLRRRDVAYALVLVWAFVGIAVEQRAQVVVFIAALAAAALVTLGILTLGLRPAGDRPPTGGRVGAG